MNNAIHIAKLIGDRIQQARIAKNMNQSTLAQKAGIHRVTMSRIEQGKYDTGVIKIARIAKVLCVSIDYLVEPVEPKEQHERVPGAPWL